LSFQPLPERFEPADIARDQDEIITAVGKTVGIDGADAARCAGNEGSSLSHDQSPFKTINPTGGPWR
jgi:hypothetical protein